jgi:hypothetical protein
MSKKLIPRPAPPEQMTEDEWDHVVWILNYESDWHGGAVLTHDQRNFYMRDRRSGKRLLEAPKIAPLFFELFHGYMLYALHPDYERNQ